MLEVQLASSSKWSCKHHSLLYNVMLLQQCGEERRLRILPFWPPSQQLLDDTFSLVMSTHNNVMSTNSSGDMHIYLQQLSTTMFEFLKQQCQWQQHIQSAACFDSILMPMHSCMLSCCVMLCVGTARAKARAPSVTVCSCLMWTQSCQCRQPCKV